MLKPALILCTMLGAVAGLAAAQPSVRVEPANLQGPRVLEGQTSTGAIRDYLESWAAMRSALRENRADLLDRDFVGDAKEKLTDTIQQQSRMDIRTVYQDRAHDLQIVFYSPDGLSIELTDKVDYEVQLFAGNKLQATQLQHARYIVVLTPAEVRWRVRVLQAAQE
jgi:hypothetical protein